MNEVIENVVVMEKVKLFSLIEKPITGEWGSEGNSIPVLRTTNFSNEGRLNLKDIVYRDIDLKKIESKKLKNGDIIIEKSGGSPTQPVGRVVYFDLEGTFLCNNFTSILRPKKDIIQSKYLLYQLFASHKFGFTNNYQNKTTGIINLKLERYIKELEIPLPSLPTQQKIASILDKADELRQYNQQLIERFNALTQSLFLEMFGDPVRNEKGWEKSEVINYCTCIVPGRDKPKSFTGEIPWVTTDDLIHLGKTNKSKKNIGLNNDEILNVKAKKIPLGSVIITCVGNLGVVSINEVEMIINQQLHAFQCLEKLNNVFLMHCLSYQKSYMYKMASSTTVPYMNKTICNNIPIIVPPTELQKQFAERVQIIEAQKQQAQEALDKSEDLFQSLLQRAFKGELN